MLEKLWSKKWILRESVNLYTIGYEGTDLCAYISALKQARVDVLIDVRETAWSYKRDFCKTALSNALNAAGIDYVHLKSAGNPKQNRRTAKSMQECLERFRQHLIHDRSGVLELAGILAEAEVANRTACLTCFERDASSCHRSVLALALADHLGAMHTHNIQPELKQKVGSLRIPKTHDHKAGRVHEKIAEEKAQGILF